MDTHVDIHLHCKGLVACAADLFAPFAISQGFISASLQPAFLCLQALVLTQACERESKAAKALSGK